MKIAVIADDLTGANATGILLTKYGFDTATILQGIADLTSLHYDVVCLDTDSRYLPKELAYEKVRNMASLMLNQGISFLCKRIDSTVRGNIGAEIDAVLDVMGGDSVAVVIPSFPDSGRTMVGGYLLVNGLPVQETDVAKDPQNPLKESFVPSIISRQTDKKLDQIGLNTILKGKESIAKRMNELLKKNIRIIIIDAVTDQQIKQTASAMAEFNCAFLPVDPGPLTAAYAKRKFVSMRKDPKILLAIGSNTNVTKKQVEYLMESMKVTPVYLDPQRLASADTEVLEDELNKGVTEGLLQLKKETILIITTNHPNEPSIDLEILAFQQNMTKEAVAKKLTDGLAMVSQRIFQENAGVIRGFFSSGGEVTASLCKLGKTSGIYLMDEVLPLAAFGRFIGGDLDGIPVVTKGGLIGDEKAIVTCVLFLSKYLKK